MNSRLEQFMHSEQLSAAKLAEILQIQPSSISHLLSGRNKPSFEFISRIMKMFPELNPDWLINDQGAMYRAEMINVNKTDAKTQVKTTTSNIIINTTDNKEDTEIKNVTTIQTDHSLKSDLFSNNQSRTETNQEQLDNMGYTSINNSFTLDISEQELDIKHKHENLSVNNSPSESYLLEQKIEKQHSEHNSSQTDHPIDAITPNISKVMIMYDDKTFEIFKSR